MEPDEMLASDMALLATASALLHYALGFYGLVAVYVLLGLAENGGALWRWLQTRGLQLRSVLDGRANASDYGGDAGGGVQKALHRQPTWRVDDARSERARSDARTEPDDDDADDANEQLLETNDSNLATNTDANGSNDKITVTPAERRAKQLLAKLSIRDVFASSSSSSSSSAEAPPPPPRLVPINARAPVAFETDLFAGHALFLVRTAPEDPHYAPLFAGKRRTFWIQVQGRFKRRPRGTVFLGGELPGRISLGLFTKSVALVILGIIQSLVGKVHVSFGGKRASGGGGATEENKAPAENQEELPAVSFPLYQSVDQFMVTPEGEEPPPLGRDDFGESEQARARRRQTPLGRGDQVFDVGPTYSFHFHTMYVNLAQWKTANLPGLSDMHLTTFFDALPLRLVAYDVLASTSNRHLQAHKQYLFNFEVAFDAQAVAAHDDEVAEAGAASPRPLWRTDSEHSFASSSESTGTAPSIATTFESATTSPCPTIGASSFAGALSEDQVAISDALATIDRENARALRAMRLEYLYWIEELDAEMGLRRVQYVFRVREQSVYDEDEDEAQDQNEYPVEQRRVRVTERLVVVSAYRLRLLLGTKFRKLRRLYTLQSMRFHARARIDSYSIIGDEARDVAVCIERLLALSRQEDDAFSEDNEALVRAFESALYQILTARTHLQLPHDGAALSTELTPLSIGVKLSRRDRDGRGVAHEGVVYRFYADTVARQEAMVLTATELQFFRSQSSSPDKIVAADRVIGVQATSVPYATNASGSSQSDSDRCMQSSEFAFALQINTFAEEIVVCVATEHARNAWIREILQHCCPHANFDRSLQEDALVVCYTPTKALKPANRVALNSRSLFPRANRGVPSSDHPDAVGVVTTALRSALRVHELGEDADVMTILEFLNHASALRGVDLSGLMERPHEERLAFFLNLYHLVLAHAMIAHGFPRAKAQWGHFQTHMCYVVGRDARHAAQPLTMSLAEIEHVLLRARLPPAVDLPHLRLDQIAPEQAARLAPFGLAHPDFRVSFALLMNHSLGRHVPVFEPETLHEQLNAIVQQYVAQHLRVDRARQTIFLPRICEWFRHDFGGGGSPLYCVRKLLGFLADGAQQDALDVLDSPTLVHIKYGEFKYVTRTSLRLATASRTSFAPGSGNEDDGPGDSQTA